MSKADFCLANQYGYRMNGQSVYTPVPYQNALDRNGRQWMVREKNFAGSIPKIGSHDSGPATGFFYGGFGTASFSRGASGFFDRWQLQQGIPVICPIDSAYLEIRWSWKGRVCVKKLRISDDGFRPQEMEWSALFPVTYEHYHCADMPFEVVLEIFSPVIPHNLEDSILPVTLFHLDVTPLVTEPVEVSVCLCWPHLLGWKQPYSSAELPKSSPWPRQQNAGNYAVAAQASCERVDILQKRTVVGEPDDLCGEIMLSLECPGWEASYEAMFKETETTTGYPAYEQIGTIGKVRHDFASNGKLSNSDRSWQAHWHETIASALAANTQLETNRALTFAVTMALPVTQFGMGRKWYKLYTENPGRQSAAQISSYALQQRERWQAEIERFHQTVFAGSSDPHYAAAKINELYFLTSGGTVCVAKPTGGWDEESGRLGRRPHFGLLEGVDTGYYYYNTLDLWVYAFTALSQHWPQLAQWGFADYLASAALCDERKNMIYRSGKLTDNLIYGKLPHDLGGCAEDLFVRLNGYNYRDTPNMWKDHNPAFVAAFYLHKSILGEPVSPEEYQSLQVIMDFTAGQDTADCGVPPHSEFGDSTWDNLQMRGLSAYCCGLCIAAWAVMERLADERSDSKMSYYKRKKELAQQSLQTLWNGKYFATSQEGKYARATMSDGLFGILLAHKAGLTNLVPMEQIRSHLQETFQNNVLSFAEGRFGALLVAEPRVQRFEQDGGDEMQVNEVIVGSSWVLAACLKEFGLEREAELLQKAMVDTIHNSRLQFRTPAAWNQDRQFRAPMNMRPLAIWLN